MPVLPVIESEGGVLMAPPIGDAVDGGDGAAGGCGALGALVVPMVAGVVVSTVPDVVVVVVDDGDAACCFSPHATTSSVQNNTTMSFFMTSLRVFNRGRRSNSHATERAHRIAEFTPSVVTWACSDDTHAEAMWRYRIFATARLVDSV